MFGGGGSSIPPPPVAAPPPAPVAEEPGAAKERSEAEANARRVAKNRKGRAALRLTDPITDLEDSKRVSLLGGGEYDAGSARRAG